MSKGNRLRLRLAPGDLRDGVATIAGAELHHLRVRRLGAGDAVLCFDDSGTEYEGVIRRVADASAEIEVTAAARPRRESTLDLVLAQALLKGDRLDLVVEKATELGASAVVLFTCERSLARPSPPRLERLRRIAAAAAKQCGRLRVPDVRGPLAFDEVAVAPAILLHPDAEAPLAAALGERERVVVVVGPEGGFTAAEVDQARVAGCRLASLGPRVLRAETAALAATALCQHLRGDLGARLA